MTIEEDFDLAKIDQEMRMERIRQSSQKLTWEGFGQALRRNLMEKRLVFDAESRLDVIQAIGYMRRHMPVDASAHLIDQLRQLSDSLECTFHHENNMIVIKNNELHIELLTDQKTIIQCRMGFFGRPIVDSPEAKELLDRQDFESLRGAIYSILNAIPATNNHADRQTFISSLEAVEGYLSQQGSQTGFERVNNSPVGYVLKRDSVHLTRIYYFVDGHYEYGTDRKSFEAEHDLNLPYLELSLVSNEKEAELPIATVGEPWNVKKKMAACWCLRFSVPLMICEAIWRQMEKYLARYSVIRQHVNSYVYTSDFDFKSEELVLRTNFPSHVTAHCYLMNVDALKEERDVIIGEIYLDDIRNLDKVLSLLRTQQVHNALWESVLCATRGTWKGGNSVRISVHASPTRFELKFFSTNRLHSVEIEQSWENKKWSVAFLQPDGSSLPSDIDKQLTTILNRSFNIPCVMIRAITAFGARGSPDPVEACSDTTDLVASFTDKLGDSWLTRTKHCAADIESSMAVENEEPAMGFLSSFKEIEDVAVPLPARPEALPRTARLHSEQSFTAAFSDLEKLCQIEFDGDAKTPTPLAKFDSSPAPRFGGPIIQLSPLENARLRMAHSVSIASSGLPSTPDVFDFPDDRSVGSGSSYPSPSPHGLFPFAGSPTTRGGAAKRRPRQRKAANMGDRTASTDSTGSDVLKKPRINKPSMMASLKRGARGSRKSSGLPMPELERPQLQRSFSDYMTSFPPTPTNIDSPYPEDDSDDEACDPPPPPKHLDSLIAARAAAAPPVTVASAHPAGTLPGQVQSPSTQGPASGLLFPPLSASAIFDPNEKTRVQPARKNSLEMLLQSKKLTPPVLPNKKSVVSDIYDDGLDSPPLRGAQPTASTPTVPTTSAGPSTTPLQQIGPLEAVAATNSPKAESSNDGVAVTPTKFDKSDINKIILKIAKQRAAMDPSAKSAITTGGEKDKSGRGEKEKPVPEKKKKEAKREEKPEKKERADRPKEESKKKRKAESGSAKDKPDHKRHKPTEPPTLPFLSHTLKNFKIPKKEDKDAGKEAPTPTTPLAPITPTLPSPTAAQSLSFSQSNSFSSSHTLPPMNKPNIKKNSMSSAAIRLNLPATQPATYLPSKKPSTPSIVHNRRPSGAPPSSNMPGAGLSSIPLPKGPGPDRPSYDRPSYHSHQQTHSAWIKPPSVIMPQAQSQQPPPRSPSPDAMQIDEAGSPEDTLQIAEE